MIFFLLCSGLSGVVRADEVEPPRQAVPGELLEQYFAQRPHEYLVDPQDLVEQGEQREQESFLRYHAGDSEIELRVLLFGRGQKIPEDVRVEELGERFESEGKPLLVALYFMGEPERTVLELSPALRDRLDGDAAERILLLATKSAAQKAGELPQLKEFCVQMATRTFELESAAGLVAMPESTAKKEGEGHAEKRERGAIEEKIERWMSRADEFSLPILLSSAAIILGGAAYWIIRSRAVYVFPETQAESRLGGEHGAGIGPVIAFGSSKVSPTKQRDQTHDPLGGI
ncbi:MAG: hypothetical protein MUF31_03615 [Akkermansiaceae bacterium]|jgi:DNA-binding protein YbaB|nr:hypothetical protein [Akkermansiaceae bacterium]